MVLDVALMMLAAGFAAALGLGALMLRMSRRLSLLAEPNARSSHVRPTPTGGGVMFALPVLAWLVWLAWLGSVPAAGLAAAGAALTASGFWDDARELPAWSRLLVQIAAAAAVIGTVMPQAGWLLMLVGVVALAWHVNLYNFMDGIDGIAASQGLVFLLGAQIIAGGLPGWGGDVAWLAAGGLIAFLAYNWPPARMFMGDAGSGFLGVLIAGLALLWWQQGAVPLASSLILLAWFWFDATSTLIVRAVTGQAFTQAHRSHLYQKLAAKRGHLWTTVCLLLYAVLWLLPLAWLCALTRPRSLLLDAAWVAAAAAPLALAAWRVRAGVPSDEVRRPDPQ